MFAIAEKKHARRTESSLVSVGTVIVGNIIFAGDLRIDGEVKGDVRCPDGQHGTLIIGEKGCIHGDIEVDCLSVNGLVTGRVATKELLKLLSKARVNSDVTYAAVEIDAGAVVQGCLMRLRSADEIEDFKRQARASEFVQKAASL